MFRSSGLFHGLFLWQKMKYEAPIAMLMVFIIILFCTSLSKFRSWSDNRKESHEETITPRAPMEKLIKAITIIIINIIAIVITFCLFWFMVLTVAEYKQHCMANLSRVGYML